MSFPDPIPLDDAVLSARKVRRHAITKVALIGFCVRLFIVFFELLGFFLFDSQVLLLDSLATLADCISSVVLVVSILFASRPPDKNHPFGHGRFEPIAGLQLGVFLFIAGLGMFVQQLVAFYSEDIRLALDPKAFVFALVTVIFLECMFRHMKKIAEREKSEALYAEALHFRADTLNSLVALVVLLLGAVLPQMSWHADRVGAFFIALCMCVMGLVAAKKNINQLLDRIPESAFFEKVRNAALKVSGVQETEKIRIQHYGPDAHVDIDIEVDPALCVEEAHLISQKVRSSIQNAWPNVQDVVVHIEPFYPGDHSTL